MAALSPGQTEFELELPCEPGSVTAARGAAGELAERVGAPSADVRLAVSEAVGNCVVHAYRGGAPGMIRLSASVARDRLLIQVADDGIGMTPNPTGGGLGFGLSLIAKMAEDVRFDSSDSGTTVSMSFPIDSSREGA